jgi:putative flippase GtrA
MNPRHWLRFIISGSFNFAVTYGIYYALHLILHYQTAYVIAYIVGIVIAYVINSLYVFRVPLSWARFLGYPLVYVIQYVASAFLLALCVEYLSMSERFAPIAVMIATIPVSYALNKVALSKSGRVRLE